LFILISFFFALEGRTSGTQLRVFSNYVAVELWINLQLTDQISDFNSSLLLEYGRKNP